MTDLSKIFLRHTFTKNIFDIVFDSPFKPRILNPYLYTFSLYENASFTKRFDLLIITPPPLWKTICDALVIYYCVSKY